MTRTELSVLLTLIVLHKYTHVKPTALPYLRVTAAAVLNKSVELDWNKAVRQSPDLLFIATSFWFEESPSAVRTNKAGLGRLCTLFVCSTLLVFEHTHAVLSSTLVLCCTMVTTSTAAMSNSRYADTDRMKNVFLIRFSKAHLDRTKAGRMPADWKALPLHLSIRTPTCVHWMLSVILCSLWTVCTAIYL